MKVFRNIFAAIVIGTIGGLAVSTISYYNQHKEGGIAQTLLAVTNSFDTIAKAYSSDDANSLLSSQHYEKSEDILDALESLDDGDVLAALENVDDEDILAALENADDEDVLAALANTDNQDVKSVLNEVIGSVMSDDAMDTDVLAMDGEDGNLDEGAPYAGIMRFHVRANSDSEEDQELKMAVKEDVVTMLEPLLADCQSVEESKSVIVSNIQNIYTTAVNTITEQGYDYEVKVYVTAEEFPAKTYGDLTFPEGKYQALRIDIGAAKGQNWWCVMYPPLCFLDETTVVVSEEGKELLKENLTAQEYADLFANSNVKSESWFYNWIKGKE